MKKLLYLVLFIVPVALLAQNTKLFKQAVKADNVKQAIVKLEMPAGELHLKTGTTQLIDAQVNYNQAGWKPVMNYSKSNGGANLTLKQEEISNKENNGENKWTINLNKTIPLQLAVSMGAGEANLDLSKSRLEKLEVEAGAVSCNINLAGSAVKTAKISAGVGELNVDMSGNWNHNATVDISGGIGDVKLKLPKGTGVRIKASGLGSRNLNGFRKNTDYHQNAALGKSKHTLTINVSGGMGSLTVVEV
ncbi:toast rack family protein [Pontibacter fetidus]|uniref:DUF2154 domain-containing protein n=1 Tax=Pontibacter fetidus TaxID=2700082 RepID=A0A6B2H836_9BACT|nr:toast rack family protein [Pontibacter fetidus]NDK56707.1 hypothetical protein [Pontibacter fetidus]